jgi:hypothetical protein
MDSVAFDADDFQGLLLIFNRCYLPSLISLSGVTLALCASAVRVSSLKSEVLCSFASHYVWCSAGVTENDTA